MWAEKSVFYQIYPLGFCDAPKENDGVTVSRILKVLDWTGYLKELGIDAVLFNPLLDSDRHGYDTRDYGKIDCRLGTNEDFQKVCRDLHEHGIKVVLDGVFNHVGRGFWAFLDVQDNREQSKYKDWFHIDFNGNSNYNDGFWYDGWEGHYDLVRLNLQNPEVVKYLLDSVASWVKEFDIDGLRLDVAYLLDKEFLKTLRTFCDGLKDEFILIGEVLFGDYNQIVNPEMLHSCTNYECYKGLYSSFNDMNMFEISHSLNRQFGSEDWCLYTGKHLMSFVDNHDVSRIASILNNKSHLRAVYGLLFSMPGIPCLYYGSEWGEPGLKGDGDEMLRPSFEQPKPNELTKFIKQLIQIYKQHDVLSMGTFRNVQITNKQLVIERKYKEECIWAAINADSEKCEIQGITLEPYEFKLVKQ